jgi:hypothetical protein
MSYANRLMTAPRHVLGADIACDKLDISRGTDI